MSERLTQEQVEEIVKAAREKNERADLSGLNLQSIDLRGASLFRANLVGADLRNADLEGADSRQVNLSRANLSEVNLSRLDLSGALFEQANLRGANLRMAYLVLARFNEAELFGANLSGANLNLADLTGANLSQANIRKVEFTETQLDGAKFNKAIMEYNKFGNVDLRNVVGLETIEHRGPSYFDILTFYRSQGKIPHSFLRGAGVPDEFINYLEKIEIPKCPHSLEQLDQWISSNQELSLTLSRRIAHLENQKASYGSLNVPFHIVEDLKDAKREVEDVIAKIAEWKRFKDIYY